MNLARLNNAGKFRYFQNISAKKHTPRIQKLSQAINRYKAKTAWGLDIGGHALKAVKISKALNGLLVEEMDIIEYPEMPFGASQTQCLKDAIQTFLTRHHIAKSDKILVSIPGQLVLSRFTSFPPVDKRRLKEIIGYEIKQQIPFDIEEIIWDYHQLTRQVRGAENIEIGFFASKKATVDQILTNITFPKNSLAALQVSSLAICNFVLFDRQVEDSTIIVNLETENTDLIIIDGARFWLRSVPLSNIDAELIKEIHRSVEYYKSLTKGSTDFKTLILMGDRFKDPGNVRFVTANFTYEFKVLRTLNNMKLSSRISPDYLNENLVSLGVAVGLAVQGIGSGRINVNLLPLELIKAAEISKKRPYAIATLACIVIALIIQYSGLHARIKHLYGYSNNYQRTLQTIKDFEGRYKKAEAATIAKKSELEKISSIDSYRFFWIEMLDKLLSLMPENVAITSIQSSWMYGDAFKSEVKTVQTPTGFFQPKKDITALPKTGAPRKSLFIGIKGETRESSMDFIKESILVPIQNLTLFEQKVPAFKNVEIVPGSCRQIGLRNEGEGGIIFEIRWIVKSQDEIQSETRALSSNSGTLTPSVKS